VAMGDPTGKADRGALRLDFDRRLLLRFRSSAITSDAGLLTYRELDDTLRLTDTGADTLADARRAGNKLALAMIPEIDIWRAASLMLKRYGEKALEESAARADELFAEQDHDGAAVWRRTVDAVRQHEAVRPAPLTT
jgi:hypothetical protein